MADKKQWEMNETQKAFVKELEAHADGITLLELKLEGKVFKTGSINTLISKGIVATDGDREFACDVMFNGIKVGSVTKVGKIYRLVK